MKPIQLIVHTDYGPILGWWSSGVHTFTQSDPCPWRAGLAVHGEWWLKLDAPNPAGETMIFAMEGEGARGNIGLIPSWSTEWAWLPLIVDRRRYDLGYRITA